MISPNAGAPKEKKLKGKRKVVLGKIEIRQQKTKE